MLVAVIQTYWIQVIRGQCFFISNTTLINVFYTASVMEHNSDCIAEIIVLHNVLKLFVTLKLDVARHVYQATKVNFATYMGLLGSDIQESTVAVGIGVSVGAAEVLLVAIAVVLYKRRVQQVKQKSEAGVKNVVKSQEEDHYDNAQPEDQFGRETTLDHYDNVLYEERVNEEVNESQYEMISSQNQYDKLKLDIEDTSKKRISKILKS
ncbi:hypothetical protein Bpfe_005566 [Biomphalaria pfeifferi]|uniref:Uncharacterized protein n=1 Tax=Biomphalaria pfeifferi TaxID=112525 RepID=A0AAD8C2D6_BIOPF|nr:hypothetical protein Bpfe_005566 [Biomphalaria pfeifferi]